jgi:hypothetical protein
MLDNFFAFLQNGIEFMAPVLHNYECWLISSSIQNISNYIRHYKWQDMQLHS